MKTIQPIEYKFYPVSSTSRKKIPIMKENVANPKLPTNKIGLLPYLSKRKIDNAVVTS
jgi:hypothetical protein